MKSLYAWLLVALFVWAGEVQVGSVLPPLVIPQAEGGYVTGGDFKDTHMRGKIQVVMFADPDESERGEALNEAIKAIRDSFPEGTYQSYAIINMKATWKPDWIIGKILASKQEKYPTTKFIKDKSFITVEGWKLKNDSYECLVVDENGIVLHRQEGPFDAASIEMITTLLKTKTQELGARL